MTQNCVGLRQRFAQVEKKIKKSETISGPPKGYLEFIKDHATVLKLGVDEEAYQWKEAITKVLKSSSAMHFSIKKCKMSLRPLRRLLKILQELEPQAMTRASHSKGKILGKVRCYETMIYLRLFTNRQLDLVNQSEIDREKKMWMAVLEWIFEIIKILAGQNIAFRVIIRTHCSNSKSLASHASLS